MIDMYLATTYFKIHYCRGTPWALVATTWTKDEEARATTRDGTCGVTVKTCDSDRRKRRLEPWGPARVQGKDTDISREYRKPARVVNTNCIHHQDVPLKRDFGIRT